jgi:hypothetical protein
MSAARPQQPSWTRSGKTRQAGAAWLPPLLRTRVIPYHGEGYRSHLHDTDGQVRAAQPLPSLPPTPSPIKGRAGGWRATSEFGCPRPRSLRCLPSWLFDLAGRKPFQGLPLFIYGGPRDLRNRSPSRLDPALHGFRSVGRRDVERDPRSWRQHVNKVEFRTGSVAPAAHAIPHRRRRNRTASISALPRQSPRRPCGDRTSN